MARRALADPFYWLTECTKTFDEQDPINPYKPFPKDEYIRIWLEFLTHEPVSFTEKSRTMMCSWTAAAYAAHNMFTRERFGVVFQSRDEDRAIHDVEYVKALWENSIAPLRDRWKLARPLKQQPQEGFEIANGSWCLGITGDPGKIRSEHPSLVVLDEAAFIETSENYDVSVATRCPQIICLSSANPGWFREMTEFAQPCEWPDYTGAKPVFGRRAA